MSNLTHLHRLSHAPPPETHAQPLHAPQRVNGGQLHPRQQPHDPNATGPGSFNGAVFQASKQAMASASGAGRAGGPQSRGAASGARRRTPLRDALGEDDGSATGRTTASVTERATGVDNERGGRGSRHNSAPDIPDGMVPSVFTPETHAVPQWVNDAHASGGMSAVVDQLASRLLARLDGTAARAMRYAAGQPPYRSRLLPDIAAVLLQARTATPDATVRVDSGGLARVKQRLLAARGERPRPTGPLPEHLSDLYSLLPLVLLGLQRARTPSQALGTLARLDVLCSYFTHVPAPAPKEPLP